MPKGPNEVGGRLLQAFQNVGITSKKEISERLGFKSENAIYKVLSGDRELSFDSLRRFAKATGRSSHWLLTGEEEFKLEPGQIPVYFGEYEQQKIAELAIKSGRSVQAQVRTIVLEELKKLGLVATQVESNVIFYGEPVRSVELPLLGWIAAGEPIHLVTEDQTVRVPDFMMKPGKRHFVLHVRGESMVDDHIPDGSLIVCEARQTANDGEKVIAVIDGDSVTVKRLYHEGDRIRLQPANPLHQPIYIEPEQKIEIQGVVVAVFHK